MVEMDFHKPESGKVADQFFDRAIRAAQAGEQDLARDLFLQVVERDPNNVDVWLWLSEVSEDAGEALGFLKKFLKHSQTRPFSGRVPEWLSEGYFGPSTPEAHPQEKAPDLPGESLKEDGQYSTHLSISVADAEDIDLCLKNIAYDSEARTIILADSAGRLIAERGRREDLNTQVLSALAAGELAATNELARLVGESARFKLLLHEGERQRVYLSDVDEKLILIVIFDNDTPIGLVRIVLKQAVEKLTPLAKRLAVKRKDNDEAERIDGDFFDQIESELDLLQK